MKTIVTDGVGHIGSPVTAELFSASFSLGWKASLLVESGKFKARKILRRLGINVT